MEFNPTAYRILKYLKKFPGDFIVNKNEILRSINCVDRDDFNDAIFLLEKENFIGGGKTDILINPEGKNYLNKIEKENEETAYEDVYSNYAYSVIKFLYNNDWGVKVEEFPIIIKQKAPQQPNTSDEGNLGHFLYNQRQYVEDKNLYYKLNDAGKEHYILRTKQKEREKELNRVPSIHIGDVLNSTGDKSPVSKGYTNQKFVEKKETEKIPWWKKILGDVRSVFVGYMIVAIVSFFTGKSCNSTPSQEQQPNSIHSIK